MLPDDRRKFQRLRLSKPILAFARDASALILDLGMTGAMLEHYGTAVPGDRFRLSFRWQGNDVEFDCEVVRSQVMREPGGDGVNVVSHTGVRFLKGIGDSDEQLKDLIATFVGHVLAAQKANAAGEGAHSSGETVLAQLGHARRTRTTSYISYRLRDGQWWRVPTKEPLQPSDGFTVAAYEDDEEMQTLCRAYEAADEEGRRLIRLVAELSASTVTNK